MGGATRRDQPTIEQVKQTHEQSLLGIDGVQGVGISAETGEPAITVYVDRQTSELRAQLPKRLDGFPVRIETSGELSILPE